MMMCKHCLAQSLPKSKCSILAIFAIINNNSLVKRHLFLLFTELTVACSKPLILSYAILSPVSQSSPVKIRLK